jgi:polyisoprenoid-binding protein YceI
MKLTSMRSILAAAACCAAMLQSGAATAQVDTAKSSITATSKQMNVPVTGTFKRFTATVAFDPARPAAGSAHFEVDMNSYDLGDPSFNDEVKKADWFDTAHFPKAVFQSGSIVGAGDGKYSVTGKLTLKGKTVDVVVPVSMTKSGTQEVFDGMLPIKRSQFGIGAGEWKDTSVVADEIVIKFHIVAAPH